MSEERKIKCCAGGASWLVIGSLAVNLFLIGVFSAPYIGGRSADLRARHGMQPPPEPGLIFERVAETLPAGEAVKLRSIFEVEKGAMQFHRKEMHGAMLELSEIIAQDKPDMAALHKALVSIRSLGEGMHDGMTRTFERIAAELSPESRRKVAERIRLPFPPPMGGPEGRRPGFDPQEMGGPEALGGEPPKQ